MNELKAKERLKEFLLEDIGERDLTSRLLFSGDEKAQAWIIAKDAGVLAGVDLIKMAYQLIDDDVKVIQHKHDGDWFKKGDRIAEVTGKMSTILTGERVVLNLLQRMSGIATLTNQAIKQLDSTHTKIIDTRKTTPGLRMFEKYAVTCGGGYNHRFGLYDGVMIKDNHIALYGSIENAVKQVKSKLGHMVKIEVETESITQVKEAVRVEADIIMFDNQSPEEIIEGLKIVPDNIVTEASGNITLDTIARFRDTGIDYISLGFITHSARAVDISMDIQSKGE
ncbi:MULTISPECIES: carboxylating nicotinate-nucleotide diphosphorylase [Paraliobacillus]|uniref:carboxylating nicotinate-nucleotide diphosphorylase n=1 Tax=Paraliobacillus TaxID=200903 RepID=UPI000DD47C0B|nr:MULTISPECIES: carboxylating nicotinate-nucleotide diphosphorylase [Paraliobacillus]